MQAALWCPTLIGLRPAAAGRGRYRSVLVTMTGVAEPSGDSAAPSDALTVLVYSDDDAVRERIRLAVGRRPAPDLPRLDYVDVVTGPEVVAELDSGEVDLAILDGEAWPTGGIGLARQLKDEVSPCPPLVVVVGRRDDAWLAAWSRAEATLTHPVDPVLAAETVSELLRGVLADAGAGSDRE